MDILARARAVIGGCCHWRGRTFTGFRAAICQRTTYFRYVALNFAEAENQVRQLIGDPPEEVGNAEENEKRKESHEVQLPSDVRVRRYTGSVVRSPDGARICAAMGSKLRPMTDRISEDAALPEALVTLFERLRRIYGEEEASRIADTMRTPKRAGFVINPLVEVAELPDGERVTGLDGCYAVPAEQREVLLEDPAVSNGAVYPMNPSSLLAVQQLRPMQGQEVLDLAAAPGGKTLQLAIAMENTGRIAAVEPVKGRFHRMRANLDRCGVTNAQFYLADGRSIGRKVPERFDRVLLDTPCSSESRIRLDEPGSYAHWSPRKTREMVRKQRGLIRSAFQALKPGGEMVYCTCAFSVEENELVVNYLLRTEPTADILALDLESDPVLDSDVTGVPGLTEWKRKGLDARLSRCRRVLPDDLFDGFFVARIRRQAS